MISGSSADAVAPFPHYAAGSVYPGWRLGGGGSPSAAQRPIGSGALLVVLERRLVVGKKRSW
jgi:hypothetical protein